MIYAAVSIANACDYCTHSHLAAARAKGMTPAEHAELLRIVATAARTNHLLNAIRPPIDPEPPPPVKKQSDHLQRIPTPRDPSSLPIDPEPPPNSTDIDHLPPTLPPRPPEKEVQQPKSGRWTPLEVAMI